MRHFLHAPRRRVCFASLLSLSLLLGSGATAFAQRDRGRDGDRQVDNDKLDKDRDQLDKDKAKLDKDKEKLDRDQLDQDRKNVDKDKLDKDNIDKDKQEQRRQEAEDRSK